MSSTANDELDVVLNDLVSGPAGSATSSARELKDALDGLKDADVGAVASQVSSIATAADKARDATGRFVSTQEKAAAASEAAATAARAAGASTEQAAAAGAKAASEATAQAAAEKAVAAELNQIVALEAKIATFDADRTKKAKELSDQYAKMKADAEGDGLKAVPAELTTAADGLELSGGALKSGAAAVVAAAVAIAVAVAAAEALAIHAGTEREKNEASFEKLGKGKEYAGHVKSEALDLGLDPQKTAEDARRLIAAHLSDKRVDMTIHATADVSELLGAEKGDQVKAAIEKLANKDKFDEAALKSLTKAGLNEDDILAQLMLSTHESKKQVLAKIKTGAIDTNTAIDAINASAEKLAGGLAEQAAKSVPALFEHLKADVMGLFDDPKIENPLKEALGNLISVLEGPAGSELKSAITDLMGAIGEAFGFAQGKTGAASMTDAVHGLAAGIRNATPSAVEMAHGLSALGKSALEMGPAMAAAGSAVKALVKTYELGASMGMFGSNAAVAADMDLLHITKEAAEFAHGIEEKGKSNEAIMKAQQAVGITDEASKEAYIKSVGEGSKEAVAVGGAATPGAATPGEQSAHAAAAAVATVNDTAPAANAAGVAVGAGLGQGMAAGIASQAAAVNSAAAQLTAGAEASARATSQTHSPSLAWARIGHDQGAGNAMGLLGSIPLVRAAAAGVATAAGAAANTNGRRPGSSAGPSPLGAALGRGGGAAPAPNLTVHFSPQISVKGDDPEKAKASAAAATKGSQEEFDRMLSAALQRLGRTG